MGSFALNVQASWRRREGKKEKEEESKWDELIKKKLNKEIMGWNYCH
jgi:hypothetical protein